LIASKKLGLPCYSSSASVNKEVEKQNDIMLVQLMGRHYQTISQLLTQILQPQIPNPVKEYFLEVMVASNLLMKNILRNFDHPEVDRLVPDPMKVLQKEAAAQQKAQQAQQQAAQQGGPGGQPTQQSSQPQSSGAPPGALGGGVEVAPQSGGGLIQ
jgi:hypothetical protein